MVRLATLPATVPRVAASARMVVAVPRPATPAVDSATWLGTALRARSATTVSQFFLMGRRQRDRADQILGGEVGHVSRDCTTEARGERVCYKCKQPGHVQAACPN